MLVTVDKERGCDPVAPPKVRTPRAPQSLFRGNRRPAARLWAAATVIAVVSSAVAVARITGFTGFSLGLGFGAPASTAEAAEVLLSPRLPEGKGMWMWQPEKSDGGDVKAMIARAERVGLSHIYVRTGSSWNGFYAAPFLDEILPAAHAAGIRVYGWDFPRLIDTGADVERALAAIRYETPKGHRIDGFAADIETKSEGTQITAEAATAYGDALRAGAGDGYPLIACVPRPSNYTKSFFPYAEVVARFDAVAPMVYWLNRQPGPDVAGAVADLQRLGKPIFPVGQAYDGAREGGRPGLPTAAELQSFMAQAHADGVTGVSFWSWQAADEATWDTIREAPQFT